jgi:hypothetical protein
MTWISFLSYLCMGYAAYYLFVVLLDSRSPPGKTGDVNPVLTFSETVEPEKITLTDVAVVDAIAGYPSTAASVGLGGVSIKTLFDLARQDAIQFTRSVSF